MLAGFLFSVAGFPAISVAAFFCTGRRLIEQAASRNAVRVAERHVHSIFACPFHCIFDEVDRVRATMRTHFFCRPIARAMHMREPISISDLMLINHYFQWGIRLKFSQGTRKGSVRRSHPGRDGAVPVSGDVLCIFRCMLQAVSCIHVSAIGVGTTGSGGSRISAPDDDNALNRMKG
jgi:hypothetical protein